MVSEISAALAVDPGSVKQADDNGPRARGSRDAIAQSRSVCCARGDATDRDVGRLQSRHLGAQASLLAGFAILPIRAVLYTFSDNSLRLIAVQ